jgi:hypothetical protein
MAEENEIITSENAEAAPVVENEETEIIPVVEEVLVGDENKEFDVNAFADISTPKKEEVVIEDDGGGEEILNWASYDEEDVHVEKPSEVVVEAAPVIPSTDGFKAVADELGLKFETVGELKQHLIDIEEENNKLRASSGGGATNETVTKLTNLKNKDSEELVRLSLEKQGFTGEELTDAVDKYIDNGMLEIEAKKIRNTIDNAIVSEQNKITQSTVDSDATQQREHDESVRKLGEHISKTETMFGLSMAKDKDSLAKVQQGHLKYISSGKFMEDVFKDDASLSEAAWFVKNKDTIIKAISNKSLQQGKQAILDDIGEPEVIKTQRFKDVESDSFDPKAFTFGQVKIKN